MKKYNRKMCSAIFLILIMAGIVQGCGTAKKIDLMKYYTAYSEGVNGYGYIDGFFDYDGFTQDLCKMYDVDYDYYFCDDNSENFENSDETRHALMIMDFVDSIGFDESDVHELKNGDTATVELYYDEDMVENLQLKISNDTKEYTVEGLQDAKIINPFDADILRIDFTGDVYESKAKPVNISDDDLLSEIDFGIYSNDVEDSSKNYMQPQAEIEVEFGESYTICVVNPDDILLELEEEGYYFVENYKEYTVQKGDIDTYVSSSDEITENALNTMKSLAQKEIKDYYYDRYGKKVKLKYEGYYFMNNRTGDTSGGSSSNITKIVYSTEVDGVKQYCPVSFSNLVVKTDGTIEVPSYSGFFLYTYDDITKMKYEEVAIADSKFDYEAKDGLE